MRSPKRANETLAKATCAALLAASFAACQPLDAASLESMGRYCQTSWRQAGIPQAEWEDCTQETVVELLERLPSQQAVRRAIEHRSSQERRELMRSIWCVAKRYQRALGRAPASLDVLGDAAVDAPAATVDSLAQDELLELGFARLSEVQRQILEHLAGGYSVAETAKALDLPPARVSDQKYKAVKRLQRELEELAA